jgi:hypothetical protein
MKKRFILVFSVVLFLGFVLPVFGHDGDFAYLDHMLVYRTGKNFYINRMNHNQYTGPFTDKSGKIYSYGIEMWSDSDSGSGTGFAEYMINGAYSRFEATLVLEKVWLEGDMGTTRFIIYADGTEIFNVKFISSSEPQNISVVIPSNTQLLRLEVEQIAGSRGSHGAIWGHAILKK